MFLNRTLVHLYPISHLQRNRGTVYLIQFLNKYTVPRFQFLNKYTVPRFQFLNKYTVPRFPHLLFIKIQPKERLNVF